MEQYLPGVLQAELYNGWPAATFEAQAVAARSFAAMQGQHRQGRNWDVTDTAGTQAYMGLATDPTAQQAVFDTQGQILAFEDNLVPGYFSSCCGGLPATGSDAVGPNPLNALPPLAGHASPIHCSEAPVYSWTLDVSADAAHRAIQDWAQRTGHVPLQQLSGVQQIDAVDHNDHGRPRRLRVVDRGGHEAELNCVDITGILMDLPKGPPMSGWFSAKRVGDQLELEGRGFGHGAGLCQYGAAHMGQTGATGREILAFYYPGAVVQQAWPAP
jgi:stage II sporulation protein D